MLGKLAKWLRVMGIDVMYGLDATDAQLLQCAEQRAIGGSRQRACGGKGAPCV